mgnify:CR=1 FL=1
MLQPNTEYTFAYDFKSALKFENVQIWPLKCNHHAADNGTVTYDIIGKAGRIAVVDDKIRIICGVIDVFVCPVVDSKYYLLMSGDGVTVEGQNTVSGNYDTVTAYYTYYRK